MNDQESKPVKPLFREVALKHQEKSLHSDESLWVLSYNKWSSRICTFLLVLIGIIWLIWGSIPIETQGLGIAVNAAGLYNLDISMKGVVKTLHVQVGDLVEKGQLVATLYNPELEIQLDGIQKIIKSKQEQLRYLNREVHDENKLRIIAIKANIEAITNKIQILENDIPIIMEDLNQKKLLAAKGLVSSITMEATKDLLWNKESDLEKTKVELSKANALLKKEYREDEIKTLEEVIRRYAKDKAAIEAQLQYARIYSPVKGLLLEWFAKPGSNVDKGNLIARLEIQEENQRKIVFYGYIPIENKRIVPETPVLIELSNVNSQEYGAMLGRIISVSKKAISPEALTHFIHNSSLIEYLQHKQSAVIEVIIEPELDPRTPSGYRWTSGIGPSIELSSGTLCSFKGRIEEISPLYYFFPLWRLRSIPTEK